MRLLLPPTNHVPVPRVQPTILDLHSGALSYGQQFINAYEAARNTGKKELFSDDEFAAYRCE